MSDLFDKIARRAPGIALYGIAPPKRTSDAAAVDEIARLHVERCRAIAPDGLVVYDIQDESERTSEPRPFPFLPTIDPETYASVHLGSLATPKIVYRAVHHEARDDFVRWLDRLATAAVPRASVLVGAPSRQSAGSGLHLADAYDLARRHAPALVVGGIAIAERHTKTVDEHERMQRKVDRGCRFFVTQAVYDVTSAKSLLSDYALSCAAAGRDPVPIVFTFAPCGSEKTLAFMKWLGIAFPRWLENELRHSTDVLQRSVELCESVYGELRAFAREKDLPIGINVESVSIRKVEIEASLALFRRLRALA